MVRKTNQAVDLLDWIRGKSDYCIYITDMWIDGEALWAKAEHAIEEHVRCWMNQLVTQARVLLTDLSYQLVVTRDLQGKLEAEFGNTMLLRKLTGVDTNPVNGLKENNMGETNISQNNRATLGEKEQGKVFHGVK